MGSQNAINKVPKSVRHTMRRGNSFSPKVISKVN